MPLNVEIENADGYDTYLMRKLLNLTKSSDKIYSSKNNVLESILISRKVKGPMLVSDNPNDSIDLKVTPYLHNGKKISIDDCGRIGEEQYGLFVIEVSPSYGELNLNKIPSYVTICKKYHDNALLMFESDILTFNNIPMYVMLNVFYNSRKTEKKETQTEKIPPKTTSLDNLAA